MTINYGVPELVVSRLANQHLTKPSLENPADVVQWLGAVQGQDYRGALWGIGLRTRGATEVDVEKAIASRSIVRTWPMRGTLHFVPATDVRWMLELLTPRVIKRCAGRYRQLELNNQTFARSARVIVRALEGDRQLTRSELYRALEAAKIDVANQRGIHILSHLAQTGLICFGAPRGKQQTLALLDEWVPSTTSVERDEGLAKLAGRYFRSHGPATLQDFAWWSGLTMTDVRNAVELAKDRLVQKKVDDKVYWSHQSQSNLRNKKPTALLLPVYDEYTVAYRDRSAILNPKHLRAAGNGIFTPAITVDGQIVGRWTCTVKNKSIVITTQNFQKLVPAELAALERAAKRYGAFLATSVVLSA